MGNRQKKILLYQALSGFWVAYWESKKAKAEYKVIKAKNKLAERIHNV